MLVPPSADIVSNVFTTSAGFTNIDPVIEEINHINKTDYVYVIISGGITEASGQHLAMMKRFAPKVKLILVDYIDIIGFVDVVYLFDHGINVSAAVRRYCE